MIDGGGKSNLSPCFLALSKRSKTPHLSVRETDCSRSVRALSAEERQKRDGEEKKKERTEKLSSLLCFAVDAFFFFFFFFLRKSVEEKFISPETQLAQAERETPLLSFEKTKMDDAKENAVATAAAAAPGKPSWPLPSPSTGGSNGGAVRKKRPSSSSALPLRLSSATPKKTKTKTMVHETILFRRRRAVDVLAHMATTAAVRDLAAAL